MLASGLLYSASQRSLGSTSMALGKATAPAQRMALLYNSNCYTTTTNTTNMYLMASELHLPVVANSGLVPLTSHFSPNSLVATSTPWTSPNKTLTTFHHTTNDQVAMTATS